MIRLRETEGLFHSNLFRMQIEEVLLEVKPNKKDTKAIKTWLEKFIKYLSKIPESSTTYSVSIFFFFIFSSTFVFNFIPFYFIHWVISEMQLITIDPMKIKLITSTCIIFFYVSLFLFLFMCTVTVCKRLVWSTHDMCSCLLLRDVPEFSGLIGHVVGREEFCFSQT